VVPLANGNKVSKHVFADETRVSTKVTPPEKVYFYHPDHLGSTQYLTDLTGEAYEHLEYFPSGEQWADDGPQSDPATFFFTGKELDESTGLTYFGHRYYDPRVGQWTSADPILDGMLDTASLAEPDLSIAPFHLPGLMYGYAGNDPVDQVDQSGLHNYNLRKRPAAGGAPANQKATVLGARGQITAFHEQYTTPAGTTDERPTKVVAQIAPGDVGGPRSGTTTQTRAYSRGQYRGEPNDDAGHIVGSQLGGPGDKTENIIGQDLHLNRGEYKKFESAVADYVRANVGAASHVSYTVELDYNNHNPGRPGRPHKITVSVADHSGAPVTILDRHGNALSGAFINP